MMASSVFLGYYKFIKSDEFKVKPVKMEELSQALEDIYNTEYIIYNSVIRKEYNQRISYEVVQR
jgi:hypothetical protein